MSKMKQLIRNVDGVVIGYVEGRNYRKRVRRSIHFLHEPPGWANDVQALEDAKRFGATTCAILDIESGVTYSAPIDRILTQGVKVSRGHGEQVVLTERFWTTSNTRQPRLMP